MTIAEEYQDLDEYLADEIDYETRVVEAPAGADDANRALRRLARIRRRRAAAEDVFRAEIDRIQARLADRLEVFARQEQWELDGLAAYHAAVLRSDPSAKTLHLPCGTLTARAQQPAWEYDETAFLAWATEHAPQLVRIPDPKPAPDKTAVKKTLIVPALEIDESGSPLTEDGEVVPGVTVTVRGLGFTVDTEETR